MPPTHSTDRCQQCGDPIIVVNVIRGRIATIRYLGCRRCGWRPFNNKVVEFHHYKVAHSSNNNRRRAAKHT